MNKVDVRQSPWVVAEGREQADDAADAVEVEYEPLRFVKRTEDAVAPGDRYGSKLWKPTIDKSFRRSGPWPVVSPSTRCKAS